MELKTVARVFSPFGSKFAVPRQSGLVPQLRARLVFEKEFRDRECLRGIEGFSHLWLLWGFSENADRGWSPTVRPPRLGGNARVGVFASRSPFRPNPLGLSCVRLLAVEWDSPDGPALLLGGADLTDGTPVYDIKPYIAYADSIPEAAGGFTAGEKPGTLPVTCPAEERTKLPEETWAALEGVLACDPRPHYHRDPARVYGFPFAGREVRFRVTAEGVEVVSISDLQKGEKV
jgi:tRNA-Thr(GGU) m(6)t(6)A37 methyltransferase TsaA